MCEGVDWLLNGRTPNSLYTPPSTPEIACLLKNFRLSDDIAFRFSNHEWPEYPLTASKFAGWLHKLENSAENINLFMDYETFGEHQWEGTGIFDFLKHLPEEILMNKNFDFKTPSEIVETQKTVDTYDVHNIISWADTERDLSAWLSNSMQEETLNKIYKLEAEIKKLDNKDILDRWSKLQISDHFYYMCTKYWGDGVVHKYFSPYNSPYDSYIYYINVLSDLELLINQQALEKTLFS